MTDTVCDASRFAAIHDKDFAMAHTLPGYRLAVPRAHLS